MKERKTTPDKNPPNIENRMQVDCDAIIIVGLAGSGKSTLMKAVAERIKVTPLSTSNVIRAHQEKHRGESGYVFGERKGLVLKDDIAPDRLSRMYLQRAISSGEPIVLDARRGALEAMVFQEERQRSEKRQGKFLTVFLTSSERFERIWKRELQKNPNLTLEEARGKTLEREKADVERWKGVDELYPGHYYAVSPYDPDAFKHDLILDNQDISQSVEKIINALVKKGYSIS